MGDAIGPRRFFRDFCYFPDYIKSKTSLKSKNRQIQKKKKLLAADTNQHSLFIRDYSNS